MRAAERIGSILLLAVVGALHTGCARTPVVEGDEPEEPVFPTELILMEDVEDFDRISDPWEGFNRAMYRFNYRFDNYVLLPAVIGYKKITPDPLERGIHNFFTNFRNFTVLFNSILQFSPRKSFETTGRLVVNSTIGLAGLFDPATAMNIPQHNEDFGQTLGVWGVPSGPYLVLPLFGPSSVRDGTGLLVDFVVYDYIREEIFDPNIYWRTAWTVLLAIDTRAHINFLYYQTGSPWEYDLVRTLYSAKRDLDIEK